MQTQKTISTDILFEFEMDIPLKISANKIYSGIHFHERMKHKEIYLWNILSQINRNNIELVTCNLLLDFTFKFKSRPLDVSNTFYMIKLIEDSLKNCGIIKDDSLPYVGEIRTRNILANKDTIIIKGLYNGKIIDNKSNRKSIYSKRRERKAEDF